MKTKSSEQIAKIIKQNWLKKSFKEIAPLCGLTASAVRGRGQRMKLPPYPSGGKRNYPQVSLKEQIEIDKRKIHFAEDKKIGEKKYKDVLKKSEQLEKELQASIKIKAGIKPYKFEYKVSDRKGESVAVVVASDWHIEETIKPETVNGLNQYTLSLAEQRTKQFFQNTLKLVQKEQNESKIETLVLALLGDFITGNIHEEFLETCSLRPMEAIIMAENLIIGGIDYLLENSDLKLVIPCAVGNHTRITKQVHISTEQGNSLETFMYHHMRNHYKDNKRVTFMIAEGYLSYLTLWNFTICFQHGHAIKYGGGVGGLTIPMNKAMAQWEKLRHADLYVAGHWHTFFDGGNFIINGSMIGYNPFAIFIKANFERPKQAFFLINRKYNAKTVVIPIMFDQ